jgi:hypothetical protein
VRVGRRGLANGIALKAIRRMREQGCEAISAVIGPSICGLCYEVPQEMHDEMVALWPAASARTSVGTPALDLRAGLEQQLLSAGVEVRHDDRCTRESVDLYSHRRDGGPGRFAAVVWR